MFSDFHPQAQANESLPGKYLLYCEELTDSMLNAGKIIVFAKE
jgi:hypothetical protein